MASLMQSRVDALTPRQKEVVRLASLGCDTNEIAAILGISQSTVDNHKAAAMKTLGTDKATILTRLSIQYKISPLTDRLTASERKASGRKNDGWN
jgi:DNA-binding CsgD family transcriptional regulator